ncbi:MAG TPA: hypothetical protein VF753_02870 [Terriglobales bacterium]
MLRQLLVATLFSSLFCAPSLAQYGTAPEGDFPASYNGDTFSGTVTAAETDQLTLTYTKGSKTDTFVGKLAGGCAVPTTNNSNHKMTAADIPKDTVMIAYFNRVTKKVDGQKTKENQIIAVSFEVWHGQKISDEKKKIWPCGQ